MENEKSSQNINDFLFFSHKNLNNTRDTNYFTKNFIDCWYDE